MLNAILNLAKKGNGFYLELDESQENQTTATTTEVKPQTAPVTKVEVEPEKPEVTTPVAAKPAQPEAKPAVNKSVKAKSQNGKASAPKAKPTPANSGASSWEQPFWVKAMYNNSNNSSDEKAATSNNTFATDYLMPTVSTSRRRPGASLNKFKDMANKAKTPKG